MAGSTALKKINARVKHLARLHPGAKRVNLQKQAGREYREGKLGRVARKKTTHRKVHHKKKRVGSVSNGTDRLDKKRVNITVGSITASTIHQDIARAKNKILDKLMYWEGKKFTAVKVSDKRKIEKRISKLKSDYKKLSYIG